MENPTERPSGRQPIPPHARKVFSGIIFEAYQWEQKLFDGTTATFEKLTRPDGVSVVAVLPDRRILVIEDEQPDRDAVITFPGGRIDEGETPETGAARELLEETGHKAERLIFWKASQPDSKIDWTLSVFIAQGCTKIAELNLDAGERIAVRDIAFDEFLKLPDHPRFHAKEILPELYSARYDKEARVKLERLLFG